MPPVLLSVPKVAHGCCSDAAASPRLVRYHLLRALSPPAISCCCHLSRCLLFTLFGFGIILLRTRLSCNLLLLQLLLLLLTLASQFAMPLSLLGGGSLAHCLLICNVRLLSTCMNSSRLLDAVERSDCMEASVSFAFATSLAACWAVLFASVSLILACFSDACSACCNCCSYFPTLTSLALEVAAAFSEATAFCMLLVSCICFICSLSCGSCLLKGGQALGRHGGKRLPSFCDVGLGCLRSLLCFGVTFLGRVLGSLLLLCSCHCCSTLASLPAKPKQLGQRCSLALACCSAALLPGPAAWQLPPV